MKYQKKPVAVDAVRWTGDNFMEIFDFTGRKSVSVVQPGAKLAIDTLEGTMTAKPGDYIIKGVAGEFYPL